VTLCARHPALRRQGLGGPGPPDRGRPALPVRLARPRRGSAPRAGGRMGASTGTPCEGPSCLLQSARRAAGWPAIRHGARSWAAAGRCTACMGAARGNRGWGRGAVRARGVMRQQLLAPRARAGRCGRAACSAALRHRGARGAMPCMRGAGYQHRARLPSAAPTRGAPSAELLAPLAAAAHCARL